MKDHQFRRRGSGNYANYNYSEYDDEYDYNYNRYYHNYPSDYRRY